MLTAHAHLANKTARAAQSARVPLFVDSNVAPCGCPPISPARFETLYERQRGVLLIFCFFIEAMVLISLPRSVEDIPLL